MVVNNDSPHKHANVNVVTQKAVRRGSFRSRKALVEAVTTFGQRYNRPAHPFGWTATADSILQKIER